MKTKTFYTLSGISLLLVSCISSNPSNISKYRNFQMFRVLDSVINQQNYLFSLGHKLLSKQAITYGRSQASINKIATNNRLSNSLVRIDSDILLIRNALQINDTVRGKPFTVEEFLKPENKHYSVPWLKKQFDEYIRLLLERVPQKYIADTTSWSRRYIKRLPPEQQKNPPSFAEFYFKGASQEEALVVLSTLQLGILQEALEIQEKILKE